MQLDTARSREELPKIPLCTNIGSNAKIGIQPCFLHRLYESNQIISPLEIVLNPKK